jgi:hypothetical protein
VEAVGELDQDDPHVRGHRNHHLAVVLGLALVAALEGDLGQLRDAVDKAGDRVAERLADLVEAGARVLDGVVEQRRAEGLGVEPEAGADLCDLDRVGDEVLARAPLLVRMPLARERERPLDRLALDRLLGIGGVLGDDRQQVAEERALVGIEVLCQRADRGARRRPGLAGPDAQVAAPVLGRLPGVAVGLV